jgi:glycine cleavage system protein P-like pyridoxal-binding family
MDPIDIAAHLAPPVRDIRSRRPAAAGFMPYPRHREERSILLISYGYIRMLGVRDDRRRRYAILNGLHQSFSSSTIPCSRRRRRAAHELIFDLRAFKASGIEEMDVAKRCGLRLPRADRLVSGRGHADGRAAESEDKGELDRF